MLRAASLAVLAASAALLLAACGGSGKPRPDLLFVSSRSGVYAIWEMNADGSRQRRLTGGGGDTSTANGVFFQTEPAWSPDGRTIAYSGGGDIDLVDSTGRNVRRLTSSAADDTHPSFSPDGKRIVFQRGTSLWIMNSDSSGAHRLTLDPAAARAPAWSPDGRWIAYSRDFTGTPVREIWLIHADGTGARRLTNLDASANAPAWSPDGKEIAFSDDAHVGGFKIWLIGVDGKGLRRLTDNATAQEIDPAWAPENGVLAFSSDGSIVTTTADGATVTPVTNSKDNDSSPAWNPIPPPAKKGG
jgi:TolB protein